MPTQDDDRKDAPQRYDVVIVGGGPAGLSAALVLGRARRRVLVCDSGSYRNAASHALHGFLSRDGIAPAELRRIAREELTRYVNVELREQTVLDVRQAQPRGFEVALAEGAPVLCRKVIIATGVIDDLPQVPGAEAAYGHTLFHCPYCDGWEMRDAPLAVYGRGDEKGAGLALELTQWSHDIVLCSDGPSGLSASYLERLARFGIELREEPIIKLEGENSELAILFSDGSALERRAMFFNTGRSQASDFAKRLGCDGYEATGCRVDNKVGKTKIHGLYVIGDASRDVLQVIVAAAEGSEAAIAINSELLRDDGVLA